MIPRTGGSLALPTPSGVSTRLIGVHIDLGKPTIVFLTVCIVGRWGPHIPSKDRKLWLACDEAHACLRDVWREAGKWPVGRYVLMPDHAHLFCAPP